MHASIDDLLGPADTRFFGAGYRRIHQSLNDLAPGASDWSRSTGTAQIRYPLDWSRKSTGVLRPHLSTVDVIALAVRVAETSVVHRHQLTASQQDALTLDQVSLRAGTTPSEDLDAVPVSAVRDARSSDATHASFDCRIGTMKATVLISHRDIGALTDAGIGGGDQVPLVESRLSGFTAAYQTRTHDIEQVHVDTGSGTCTARVFVRDAGACIDPPGLLTPPTVMDSIIVIAQLAQALMYAIDDLDRTTSQTLWMRHVTARTPQTMPSLHDTVHASTSLSKTQRVRLGDQSWRVTTMTGTLAGFHLDFSLAHQLT